MVSQIEGVYSLRSDEEITALSVEEEGGGSKEMTVPISGDRTQIDKATALLKEAMDQAWKEPTFQLCTRRKKKEELSSRFAKITPSLYSFEKGRQQLPDTFTKVNKLEPGEIILLAKDGVTYTMMLKLKKNGGSRCYLHIKSPTWEKFCLANEVRAEETFILELTEKRELKFFSKYDNETERTGSLNEKEPNLVQQVLTSQRHQTSEFRSDCPEEEHEREHSGCSDVLPRVIEEEECVALTPYPTVSDETSPEPTRPAETGDVQYSLGREAAQYPRYPHSRTDITTQPGVLEAEESYTTPFACQIQQLHFLESSGNTSTASQDSSKGRTRAKYLKERFVSTPTSAGQGAVSDQDECSLPSPLVGTNQADLSSANTEGQNIAAETGFVESSAGVAAPGQSATQPVPPVFSDPFPRKLEMLQRQSDIRKNYVEAKSLLKAEFQRRSAELNEQFKRKHDDVEAEYTAKNSDHTSSLRMFSNLQLELDKSQRQSEIEKNYEEENSLLTAELKRRRAEVYEEFKRKHDDIEAEYTSSYPSSAHCPMPQPR
uniref:TF-B3 domain-containing protein n=1 Tax=Brassica campestris TaxID=3711 RepID=M4EL71_BRACM